MKKLHYFILIVLVYFFVIDCEYTPISMPNNSDSTKLFSTGEIKYIAMNPTWDDFSNPTDIFISVDDYIYIADSGRGEIVICNKTGDRVSGDEFGNDFSPLMNLDNINPVGLCMDPKLNLFFVDRSNKIYVWNQFTNNSSNLGDGNDSVAVAITYRNFNTSDEVTITNFMDSYALEVENYIIVDVEYEYNQSKVDSILGIHVFYENDVEPVSDFVSVAASPNSFFLAVTDQSQQNIQNIVVVRSAYLKLANGTTLWQHKGVYYGMIATAGTGAGTINDPTGICTDEVGNIYYTQTGVNFGLHKVTPNPGVSGETIEWSSAFTLGINPIMDLDRFNAPNDVAIDNNGNIFVLNTGDNEVQEFDNSGNFVRKAGLREAQFERTVIDTITTNTGVEYVPRDTIITEYFNDVLNAPKAISVDDGVIYIVDTGNKNIRRFKLSSDIDIEIPE